MGLLLQEYDRPKNNDKVFIYQTDEKEAGDKTAGTFWWIAQITQKNYLTSFSEICTHDSFFYHLG